MALELSYSIRTLFDSIRERVAEAARRREHRREYPLALRLRAWWEGCEPDELGLAPEHRQAHKAAQAQADGRDDGADMPFQPWAVERLRIVEGLWGRGFISPVGHDAVLQITKPLAMNETMSVADIGCGLGGSVRTMAGVYGAWITGLEAEPELVKTGTAYSKAEQLDKKAVVRGFDPESVVFKPRCYNAVVSFDFFYQVKDKPRLLTAIRDSLKKDAHLLFTDYLLATPGDPAPEVKAWAESEAVAAYPWSIQEAVQALRGLDLDIRIAEDETNLRRRMILQGWVEFVGGLRRDEITGRQAALIMAEAESWFRRLSLMERGLLKVFRIEAINRHIKHEKVSSWG